VPEVVRAPAVDERGPLFQVCRIEQLRRLNLHVTRIGHVPIDIGECELHSLDLQMPALGGFRRQGRHVEVLQDPQRDERRDSLTVRWKFVHGEIAIGLRQRHHPVGLMCGEIVDRHGAALHAAGGRDLLRQRAAIERLTLGLRDLLQRARLGGKAKVLACLRRAAFRHEGFGKPGLVLEYGGLVGPLARDRG
jgi:hypothetical protein